ncbi:MAG: FHA domain-containing protein [Thermoguttaceae bacterium]
MSLARLVYYSTVLSGWAAFVAWLIAETLFLDRRGVGVTVEAVLSMALVGAAIAGALSVVSDLGRGQWRCQLRRYASGLVGGGIGGALGGLLGAAMYSSLAVPRVVGWMLMGLGVGGVEGIFDRSRRRTRNGLIGGALGGGLGGLLFDFVAASGSSTSARAVAFVILGLAVGGLIGLAHVVLKEAWLTVLDGYQPGRQLILIHDLTVLGRGDHLPLPFLGYGSKDVESEHLHLVRQPDGTYVAQDNQSRIGTRVNGQLIEGPVTLKDGDLIKLGSNLIRFNVQQRWGVAGSRGISDRAVPYKGVIAPPPPPPGQSPVSVPPLVTPSRPPLSSASTAPRIPPPPPPPK